MSHQAMSIQQMLQSTEKPDNVASPIQSPKRTGKVKIFYSFKDSDANCLCSFDQSLVDSAFQKSWVPLSLKRCLLSVCSSCPDQLMRSDYDTAVYSANFEENNGSDRQSVVWEGHGLLSSILNEDENALQVTGKMTHSPVFPYDYTIEVLIQLHPVRRSSPVTTYTHVLPPVKSLLLPDQSLHQYDQQTPLRSLSTSYSHLNRCVAPIAPFRPSEEDMTTAWPRITADDGMCEKKRRLSHESASPVLTFHPASRSQRSEARFITPTATASASPPTPLTRSSSLTVAYQRPQQRPVAYSSGSQHNPSKLPVDAYYHQSRRKKRDTKPPNANDVRPFVDVEKDGEGNYILPAEVDSWTVLDLGTVVWDRVAFHNQRYIYPVGYRVKKWYRSMVDPHSDTQYTCQILDGGDEPIFQLDADDNPGEVWRGPTPTTVWTIAVRRAFAIRNMDYGHNPVGPDFFGLRKNAIAKMIQDLPHADKCKNYIWQNFEAMSGNKSKAMRRGANIRINSSNSSTTSTSSSLNDTRPVPSHTWHPSEEEDDEDDEAEDRADSTPRQITHRSSTAKMTTHL